MLKALAQDDERMQAALRSSAGLCLPHLRRALALARDPAAFERLLAITQEKMAELAGELDEFIRKNDYRFSQEGFGAEGDSWRRAIAWMVGARGVR
jgi:DNA-binding transcriptional MerR regulator